VQSNGGEKDKTHQDKNNTRPLHDCMKGEVKALLAQTTRKLPRRGSFAVNKNCKGEVKNSKKSGVESRQSCSGGVFRGQGEGQRAGRK